jgi:hypothetical protein
MVEHVLVAELLKEAWFVPANISRTPPFAAVR